MMTSTEWSAACRSLVGPIPASDAIPKKGDVVYYLENPNQSISGESSPFWRKLGTVTRREGGLCFYGESGDNFIFRFHDKTWNCLHRWGKEES